MGTNNQVGLGTPCWRGSGVGMTSIGGILMIKWIAQGLDTWFEGAFTLFEAKAPCGNFNIASLGTDNLITLDPSLIGGFVQIDRLSQRSTLDRHYIRHWLANWFLRNCTFALAAAAPSSDRVSSLRHLRDQFDATTGCSAPHCKVS